MFLCTGVFSQDKARSYFEWGEYDSLLLTVQSYFSQPGNEVDSGRHCIYQAYAGVAYFANGNIAEARHAFIKALSCNPDLVLDKQYVTPEMISLFADARNELAQARAHERNEDSLKTAREKQRKELADKKLRLDAIRSRFRTDAGISAASLALGITFGALAVYEYESGKPDDKLFNDAAETGDKTTYNQMRSVLDRRNRFIDGYSIASALCGIGSAWFAYRGFCDHRLQIKLTSNGNDHGLLLTVVF
jgi:tetratricopeptide (TPR) repeat protein